MASLQEIIPSPDVVSAMTPEELAFAVLSVARSNMQNGMVNIEGVQGNSQVHSGKPNTYQGQEKNVELAVGEAWNWLVVQGLLIPAPGFNGTNGFRVLSRRAQSISNEEEFGQFRKAAEFPKQLLHPTIAVKVWLGLIRGDLEDAVFAAFKAVEVSVRKAAGYGQAAIGVPMMRNAFNPENGPLTDMNQEKGEREALMHLFAGAIGSYKNPYSQSWLGLFGQVPRVV